LKKFIHRHKVGVLASSAVASAILLGLILAITGFIQAKRQTEIARAEALRATRTLQFLQEMLTSINPDTEGGADVTVHQVLNRAADNIDSAFTDQPEVRINLHEVIGQAYYGLVLYEQAMPHLQMAVDLRERYRPEDKLALADALLRLGQAYSWDPSKHELSLAKCRDALIIYKTQVPDSDERVVIASSLEAQLATPPGVAGQASPDVWAARALPTVLGVTQDQIARLPQVWGRAIAQAQELSQEGDTAGARSALDHGHEMLLTELRNLCSAGETNAAREFIRQAYSPWMEMPLLRSMMPIILISEAWELQRDDQNLIVIEVILREAVAAGQEVWGQEHPYIARALTDLAIVLRQQGKLTEAERSAREALAMRRKLLGMEDPETITSAQCLIDVLSEGNKQSEADSLRREFDIPDETPTTKQETK
jgi:non-specific serine/threonine protein kinase/serine/threonine-protein kinase